MWETDRRVEAILNSPIGCEFPSIAAAEGLSPDAIVAPRNALWLAAFAVEQMTVWDQQHDANVEHALGQGDRLSPLAHSVLQHPGSAWWFESLDLDHQGWIEHGKESFCVEPLDGPLDTTTWQRPRTPPPVGAVRSEAPYPPVYFHSPWRVYFTPRRLRPRCGGPHLLLPYQVLESGGHACRQGL